MNLWGVLPWWAKAVITLIGLVCLVASIWAARNHKNSPRDWDYRDEL